MNSSHHAANRIGLIGHYLEMGRYRQVIGLLLDELAGQPENGELYYWLAFSHYQLDEYDLAESVLDNAARLGWDHEKIQALRGHLYSETERWVEAEEAYLAALRENPNHAGVHAAYGYLMLKAGHEDKAARLMDAARRLGPEDADVLRFRHMFKMFQGGREEQLEELERLMRHADDEAAKLIQIGLSELYRGRNKEAREAFRQAYLLHPDSKPLLDILQDLDRDTHWLLKPLQLVNRIGGPAAMYAIGFGSILLASALGYEDLAGWLALIYILYVFYSWTAYGIVRWKNRRRG